MARYRRTLWCAMQTYGKKAGLPPHTWPRPPLPWWGIEPTHERTPQGARAQGLRSRGLSRLLLLDLFPCVHHVGVVLGGRGHLVPFEGEYTCTKRVLELNTPTFHRDGCAAGLR